MTQRARVGPLLFSRGLCRTGHRISALVLAPDGTTPPELAPDSAGPVAPVAVDLICGWRAWRFDFTLAGTARGYRFGDRFQAVAGDFSGDLKVGFVSCNGKEEGDFDRPVDERSAMWRRLLAAHRKSPLSLLLHGGDQIYADAAIGTHETLRRWHQLPQDRADTVDATGEMEAVVTEYLLEAWLANMGAPGTAELMAEVPSVMMWDDHDIFDGWGSRKPPVQDGPIGQMLFRIARRFFRVFQTGGTVDDDSDILLANRTYGDFTIIAPDLRSERRLDRVMGPRGWAAFEDALAGTPANCRLFVISSVPALGPRLSIVEGLHRFIPGAQKYEDDLRDQWQSRAHREEWQRFLKCLAERMERGGPVTVLSGEIHLAARGEMRLADGRTLHQLIASGISHPPPPGAFAQALGALARLGEAPLPDRPITMRRLPGYGSIYAAERNFLILSRIEGQWSAVWELEDSGPTRPLAL